jgi:alkylation response protein AidB-like acyl-CoA dehydrogenase
MVRIGPSTEQRSEQYLNLKDVPNPTLILFIKRWITNGHFSDYFTVACRTGKGLTVFLVERGEGVSTKPIKTSYSSSAGTAFITFDNVKVPAGNMLGKEDDGLKVVLSNFNHERWVMACGSARAQRVIVEECFKYVLLQFNGSPIIYVSRICSP